MKKALNWVLSMLGFFLLIGLLLISINENISFIDTAPYAGFINFIKQYGAILLVSALVFINIIGKGIVRIILTILLLLVAAFYVFTTFFPVDFLHLFGL
ncbi:MAG: hypothetical protein PHS54_05745 [Clostridia bacterium]|nr:hypothetical protein [Clostridia bacterium]